MKTINSTLMLRKVYPEAWKALPEPYREDECLQYEVDTDWGITTIIAFPKEDQKVALGDWRSMYLESKNIWVKL